MERSKRFIIIPAYNEEKTILDVVLSLKEIGNVIVVNDCSSDSTLKKALEAGAIVVNHEKNLGYDEALNSGFKKAIELKAKYVLTFDADGQHDVNFAEIFFINLEAGIKIVLGVRPHKQRISESIFGIYTSIRYGISDILCGMKGYDTEILSLNNGVFSSFDSIGTELTIKACRNRVRKKEISIPMNKRIDGAPRFGTLIKSNIKIFSALFRVMVKN